MANARVCFHPRQQEIPVRQLPPPPVGLPGYQWLRHAQATESFFVSGHICVQVLVEIKRVGLTGGILLPAFLKNPKVEPVELVFKRIKQEPGFLGRRLRTLARPGQQDRRQQRQRYGSSANHVTYPATCPRRMTAP